MHHRAWRDRRQRGRHHVQCRLGHPDTRALPLRAARGDGTHERRLARYTNVDLLIIDDLGLRALTGEEPLDLYDIIRQRYERSSTIITSNRDMTEWAPLFNDALLASAAMDRLLHHAHIIEITGSSYRNPPRDPKARAA